MGGVQVVCTVIDVDGGGHMSAISRSAQRAEEEDAPDNADVDDGDQPWCHHAIQAKGRLAVGVAHERVASKLYSSN